MYFTFLLSSVDALIIELISKIPNCPPRNMFSQKNIRSFLSISL